MNQRHCESKWCHIMVAVFLLCWIIGAVTDTEGQSLEEPLVAFQWNPHFECFLKNKDVCASPAKESGANMLKSYNVDFANFIEIEDASYAPPAGFGMVGGNVCKQKPYGDWATLVYNATKWSPKGSASSGCLPADDGSARAFVVQDFLHAGSGLLITVAGIHFPHPNFTSPSYYKVTTDFLSGLFASRSRVLIMGDTNLNTPNSSRSLFNQLGFKGEPAASSQLFNSCCNHNAYPDDWAADRIFTNFGSYGATWKPLGSGQHPYQGPVWSRDVGDSWSEFHLPVMMQLNM